MMKVFTAKEVSRWTANENLHYQAHMEELEEAVQALVKGEDFEFTFDLTEEDKHYLGVRIHEILDKDFILDFH